jgi:hypothetical protein
MTLEDVYKLVISEVVKYHMVKIAREDKIYGSRYVPPGIPVEFQIAEDTGKIAISILEDYENRLKVHKLKK